MTMIGAIPAGPAQWAWKTRQAAPRKPSFQEGFGIRW